MIKKGKLKFISAVRNTRNLPLLKLMAKLFSGGNRNERQAAISIAKILCDWKEPSACRLVAAAYDWGTGVRSDKKEAFKYWLKGANLNDLYCQASLAHAFETGLGIKKSFKEAFRWNSRAAKRGDLDAQYNLSVQYQEGNGTTKNIAKAFELLKQCAKKGHPEACCNLGVHYENGVATTQNVRKAKYWYTLSARGGDRLAARNLRRLGNGKATVKS